MVRTTPRGGRNAITGVSDGVLQARVSAPPVDGAANASLIKLLAEALDIPPSRVTILKGHTSRLKTLQIEGLSNDSVLERLQAS